MVEMPIEVSATKLSDEIVVQSCFGKMLKIGNCSIY